MGNLVKHMVRSLAVCVDLRFQLMLMYSTKPILVLSVILSSIYIVTGINVPFEATPK